jgi:hypothetical protein
LDVSADGICEAKGGIAICGYVLLAASVFITMFSNRDWNVKNGHEENPWQISPIELADRAFYNALTLFDSYTLQIETLYGDNSEAKTRLGYLDTLIKDVKKERAKHRAGLAVVYVCAIVLVIIIKYSIL